MVFIKFIIGAVDLDRTGVGLHFTVDIILSVNKALQCNAVCISLAVGEFAVEQLTAGCAAKDLLPFGHLKGKLSLTIVVFADVGHRGAGPCNSAVGAFKPAIYGGICKVAGIGKGDGVGRAVGIKGFVLAVIIPIADSAVELNVLGLVDAVVADDEIGLLRGNETIGVTGCGDNSTPVDNRMTNLAICPAGQTILDAGGSNVRNCDSINMVGGVRAIILSGLGTVVVTANHKVNPLQTLCKIQGVIFKRRNIFFAAAAMCRNNQHIGTFFCADPVYKCLCYIVATLELDAAI